MTKRRICILGGCGGIGRSLVKACLDADDEVAVMDLQFSLDRRRRRPARFRSRSKAVTRCLSAPPSTSSKSAGARSMVLSTRPAF